MIRHKKLAYALLGSTAMLFLLLQTPVSMGVGFLPPTVRLDGSEGTLWHGRAAALGINGQIVQQNLHWDFSPKQLWRGQLVWEVGGNFQQESSHLTLQLGPTRLDVQKIQLTLPASPLLGMHAQLKGLKLGGLLHLQSAQLSTDQSGTLNGQLDNLFSALIPDQGTLGSYRLALTLQPGLSGQWQLSPQQGALTMNGNGAFKLLQGNASGSLAFKPQGHALARLQPILAMLPKQGDTYTLRFATR